VEIAYVMIGHFPSIHAHIHAHTNIVLRRPNFTNNSVLFIDLQFERLFAELLLKQLLDK